jgi:hypothetical protein
MSEIVDGEVKRMLDEAYVRARDILSADRAMLDRMAAALLERETIDREEIDAIARGEPLPPRGSSPAPVPLPPAPASPERAPARPLVPKQAPSPA